MHIGQALDLVSRYDSLRNLLTSLGDYLDPELISRCLTEAGTVTLRKRRLPLEMIVWCIVDMALERKEPLHQIVNRLDIILPGSRPSAACSRKSENELAEQLIEQTGDNTLTLMDKGYDSLGLMNAWNQAGEHRHWVIPRRKC